MAPEHLTGQSAQQTTPIDVAKTSSVGILKRLSIDFMPPPWQSLQHFVRNTTVAVALQWLMSLPQLPTAATSAAEAVGNAAYTVARPALTRVYR